MEAAKPLKATWIWYPGDFEVWLGNIFNNRRTERGAMFPPFWKQDSHYVTVEFSKSFTLAEDETITIACEGRYNLMLDGKLQFGMPESFVVPKGQHKLNLKVWNQSEPPALFITGKTIQTDSSWLVTYEDKIWIDENGTAHGSGIYVPAASWCFDSMDTPPSSYRLEHKEQHPISSEETGTNARLYDFGRETFGSLKFRNLVGSGLLRIFYGESKEEALDRDYCETLDCCLVSSGSMEALASKAFRYVLVEQEGTVGYKALLMDYEYAPHDMQRSGSFHCSDEELNRIWKVAAYTMDLTTQEFFMDGVKRDRWTWSGDAIQSYLMNYYLRFDTACVRRTIRQLRGKDPVTAHVNTIMDYTFYWFKSVMDYYLYVGDVDFIRELWPRMVSLMDYVLGRVNADGMAEGQADDWIFVDWVDFPMHKRGTLAFEQILFAKALETMEICAGLLSEEAAAVKYGSMADRLKAKMKKLFWDQDRHVWLHALEDGVLNTQVTKFPNMFAILYGLTDETESRQIMEQVMLNPDVAPITTPYMRFYELETLCKMGMQSRVLSEMKDYWGGMIREGATTFWEKYVPTESGTQHLSMYGRPYGKSLCHAWGASPLYLIGRYFLGVEPVKPGYEEYVVRPVTGGLDWMEGEVPTPFGKIHVRMDQQKVTVRSDGGRGMLLVGDHCIDIPPQQEIIITR